MMVGIKPLHPNRRIGSSISTGEIVKFDQCDGVGVVHEDGVVELGGTGVIISGKYILDRELRIDAIDVDLVVYTLRGRRVGDKISPKDADGAGRQSGGIEGRVDVVVRHVSWANDE